MARQKTKDRILQVSLDLFNLYGEPNVTTIDIANEMDISPGNLYYHYRNKDDIINELFARFEEEISSVLEVPFHEEITAVDGWMYVHMVFEAISHFRFLYRDLANILGRSDKLLTHFNRVLDKKLNAAKAVFTMLRELGIMALSDDELSALAGNIVVTTTYWINYEHIRNKTIRISLNAAPTKEKPEENENIAQGVYQVMTLISPWMEPETRGMLLEVAKMYIE